MNTITVGLGFSLVAPRFQDLVTRSLVNGNMQAANVSQKINSNRNEYGRGKLVSEAIDDMLFCLWRRGWAKIPPARSLRSMLFYLSATAMPRAVSPQLQLQPGTPTLCRLTLSDQTAFSANSYLSRVSRVLTAFSSNDTLRGSVGLSQWLHRLRSSVYVTRKH